MTDRKISMKRDITPEWECRMEMLMEIPCVHSVTWHDANNIDIIYIEEPNAEQKEQIKQLKK